MRQWLAAVLTACLTATAPAVAQDLGIEDVISAQIEAFRADDWAGAFTFASPMIQGMFGTPENFGRMVREGYPMVWRPAEVQYLGQEVEGGSIWQKVRIVDGRGSEFWLAYHMMPVDGRWRIHEVYLTDPPVPSV